MALSDLKKNSTRSTKRAFTVDEFIADAEHYAMGKPQIVSVRRVLEDEPDPVTDKGPMRHATFTLSEEAIDALTQLSLDTGVSKSKLLRQLILNLNEHNQAEVLKEVSAVVVRKVE